VSQRISDVKRGEWYSWNGVSIRISRVARDCTWADIWCWDGETYWTKRQPLPLPEGTERRPVS
jgi:hypothetical protein